MNNDIFLNPKQVSQLLGIHLRTVQRLTKKGKIKGIKIGKLWKYKREDIEKYIVLGTDFSNEPERKQDKISFIEQRAFPRINSNFNCNYSIDLIPFKRINSLGIVKNISAGGVFLFCSKDKLSEVNIDDPVTLKFVIDNKINVFAAGKVVREEKNGVGVKFKHINKELRDIINSYAS